MICQDKIIEQLRLLSTDVNCLSYVGWWHFRYDNFQMVYIPDNQSSNSIRICIPYFDCIEHYDSERISTAINETNKEVKYIKVVTLGNGSISINYDHKYAGENDLYSMLLHMLKTLCFAAEYLKSKLIEK